MYIFKSKIDLHCIKNFVYIAPLAHTYIYILTRVIEVSCDCSRISTMTVSLKFTTTWYLKFLKAIHINTELYTQTCHVANCEDICVC